MKPSKDQRSDRRQQQKALRRRDILEAGFEVFTTQGFSATRLDDVALRAGVGKGTIYLYFASKEVLFEEVVRENLFPFREEAEARVRSYPGSAADLLALHLRYVYGRLADPKIPPLMALVIGEGHRFPQLTDFFYRELTSRSQANMGSIIRRGVESGEFRRTRLEDFVQIMVAPILIGVLWKLHYGSVAPLDLEAYAETHIDLLLHGLASADPGATGGTRDRQQGLSGLTRREPGQ